MRIRGSGYDPEGMASLFTRTPFGSDFGRFEGVDAIKEFFSEISSDIVCVHPVMNPIIIRRTQNGGLSCGAYSRKLAGLLEIDDHLVKRDGKLFTHIDRWKVFATTAGPIKLDSSVGLLVSSGLLKENETRDRKAVGKACLVALEMGPKAFSQRTPASWKSVSARCSGPEGFVRAKASPPVRPEFVVHIAILHRQIRRHGVPLSPFGIGAERTRRAVMSMPMPGSSGFHTHFSLRPQPMWETA